MPITQVELRQIKSKEVYHKGKSNVDIGDGCHEL